MGGGGGGDGIRHYVPHVFVVVLHARHLPPSPFEISRKRHKSITFVSNLHPPCMQEARYWKIAVWGGGGGGRGR